MFMSKPENRPSTVRVNYSIANYKHKVYLYGGLNVENEILSTIDDFDATTYKFSHVKIRGDIKPKGRQAHCAIAIDQYNMVIIGGSYQTSLIDPAPITDESGVVMIYDMDASTFQPVQQGSDKIYQPTNLVFPSAFLLNADTIGVLWYDFNLQNVSSTPTSGSPKSAMTPAIRHQRVLKVTTYTFSKQQWRPINLASSELDHIHYRLGHSIIWNQDEQQLLIFGGTDFSDSAYSTQPNGNSLLIYKMDFSVPVLL